MATDSRAGPEAGLEPGQNFGAAGSLLPRPTGRQLPSPSPYWPASGLNLFWISNPFKESNVLCNIAPGKMCPLGLTHNFTHNIWDLQSPGSPFRGLWGGGLWLKPPWFWDYTESQKNQSSNPNYSKTGCVTLDGLLNFSGTHFPYI